MTTPFTRKRLARGLSKASQMIQLWAINAFSHSSAIGDADVAVSLTSYGKRARMAHLTIESIARGSVKPKELILWLDDPSIYASLPAGLRRLQRRGLSIRLTSNYGPHTKYFPYVIEHTRHTRALITADDDTLYPKKWLLGLERAAQEAPSTIVCYRARRVSFDLSGNLRPYHDWPDVTTTSITHRNFFLGVSGVRYPEAFLQELRERSDGFLEHLGHVDDIWLNLVALRSGYPARQVTSSACDFPLLLGSQEGALSHTNVNGGNNDRALAATFGPTEIALLLSAPE